MADGPEEFLRIDVLTLFPEVFGPFLEASILGIAASKGLFKCYPHNLRDYSEDKHHKVDDRPYGGGPGMVMRPEPVFRAYESVREMDNRPGRFVMLTPQGKRFDQQMAREFAKSGRLILLCGHYEGFDERIRIGLPVEEVSIGDYVLTGGEAAAMVIIDSVVRLLPGALGDEESPTEESFANGLLEYPHYTRPQVFRGMAVPEVLRSGNHAEIAKWRKAEALERTRRVRADLLAKTAAEQDNGQQEPRTGNQNT